MTLEGRLCEKPQIRAGKKNLTEKDIWPKETMISFEEFT